VAMPLAELDEAVVRE